MLGYSEFHQDLIKKYVTVFGMLFNDIEVARDGAGNQPQLVKVPLSYSPRDKMISFADKNFSGENSVVALVSPRIGFDMVDISYDTTRAINKFNKVCLSDGTLTRQPVPYDFFFELYILGKNAQELNRIVEQILPFFTPGISIKIFPITGNNVHSRDCMITFNGSNKNDTYQGQAEDRRSVIWTLQFTLKGWLYGPSDTSGKLIKQVIVNFTDDGTHSTSSTVQPGLTTGGQPTSDINLSIPFSSINSTDNYGFITTYNE